MKKLLLTETTLPPEIVQDIHRVVSIMRGHGAVEVILYGSLARGDYRGDSDIDICVIGLPDENYFRALAECLMNARRRVSVLDFEDTAGYFRDRILREGRVLYEHG